MRKILLLFLVGTWGLNAAWAQQRPHYSQYMFNQYLLNPAVGGSSQTYDIRMGHRAQWVGIQDAPRTFFLSAHGFFGKHIGPNAGRSRYEPKNHHGIGVLFTSDVTGPTSQTNGYVSYAYNMQISQTVRLAFGAFGGFQQYTLDGSKIDLGVNGPAVASMSSWMPDVSVGFWAYSSRFYLGAAGHQLLRNKFSYVNAPVTVDQNNRLYAHLFFSGGYKFTLTPELDFVPSFQVKMVNPAPVSFDLNTKLRYQEQLWLGVSYRHRESVVGLIGTALGEYLEVGYAYDMAISALSPYTSGSHELMLGVKLAPRGRVRSPSDFW